MGILVITDFGSAVRGDEQKYYHYPIHPHIYSAPEVMLKAGWSYSGNVWNMWDLLHGSTPFQAKQPRVPRFLYERYLANLIALLRPLPRDLTERGRERRRYFNNDGELSVVRVDCIANKLSGSGKFKNPEFIPRDATPEQ